MELRAERTDTDAVAVVAVHGDLDLHGAPQLREALLEAIDANHGKRVVLDLEGVDFLDSAGLGVLVGGLKRARSHGGDLVLVATGRNVLHVLELTGLTRAFEIHSSLRPAVDNAT